MDGMGVIWVTVVSVARNGVGINKRDSPGGRIGLRHRTGGIIMDADAFDRDRRDSARDG